MDTPIGFTGKAWRKVMDEEKEKWQKLYDGGLTLRAIGKQCRRDHATIGRYVVRTTAQDIENRHTAIQNQRRDPGKPRMKTGPKPMSSEKRKVHQIVSNAKLSARKKGVPFSLTCPMIWKMAERQHFKCSLTKMPFSWAPPKQGHRSNPYRLSIDRIVPQEGYVPENIRLVIWAINMAISEWGTDVYNGVIEAYQAMRL